MNYSIDWDRVRREVDIEQYFLFKKGSLYQFDKYKRAYVQSNETGPGDIIRFFKHEISGVKMYYSITNSDSGDIIQFIKKRILCDFNASATDINNELSQFLGIDINNHSFNEKIIPQNTFNAPIESTKYKIHGDIIQNIEQHQSYFLNFRKLSEETLNSKAFNSLFFTYKTTGTESLAFYLKDIEGEVVGVNRIQTTDNEYFNKKWFDKNSKNSIGFTFSNKPEVTETLSIFESIFDAISFQEMFPTSSTQFMATNGELSFKKASYINNYFVLNSFKNLNLCNDNDLSGHYFNLCIIANFIDCVQTIRKSTKNITIEIVDLNGDASIKVLTQLFKKSTQKYELNDDSELPQSYFTETLSKNKNIIYFMIGNSKESIEFFVGLLYRLWDLKQIHIKTPINKDFNEDLIMSKNASNG